MRIFLITALSLFVLNSCSKNTDSETPNNSCRLIKTEFLIRPDTTITHTIDYDELGRIATIVDITVGHDSIFPVYEGSSSKILAVNIKMTSGETFRNEYIYNSNNQLTNLNTPQNRNRMYYKGQYLDSAISEVLSPQGSWLRYYAPFTFGTDSKGSITTTHVGNSQEGTNFTMEYTDHKNPFMDLAMVNGFELLTMGDVFPMSGYGHANQYLLKSYSYTNYDYGPYPAPSRTITERYAYSFDEHNNLSTSVMTKSYSWSPNTYDLTRKFYYDCK